MTNNISFDRLLQTQQNNKPSTGLSSGISPKNSFSSIFSSELKSQSIGAVGEENSSNYSMLDAPDYNIGNLFMSLLRNGSLNSDSIAMFLSMLGSSSTVGGSMGNMLYGLFDEMMVNDQLTAEGFSPLDIQRENATIPDSPWKAVYPSIVGDVQNRNAATYRAVIDQFNVESNPRYRVNRQGKNDTYCNIFLWDVTRAMGAEIPHYIDPATKAPMYGNKSEGGQAMSANRIYDWLHDVGGQYGWHKVTPEMAQNLANQGRPVVTAKKNTGGHGHVQMVCPSNNGMYDPSRGVTIAQAGSNLYNYKHIGDMYSDSNVSKFTYFAHL